MGASLSTVTSSSLHKVCFALILIGLAVTLQILTGILAVLPGFSICTTLGQMIALWLCTSSTGSVTAAFTFLGFLKKPVTVLLSPGWRVIGLVAVTSQTSVLIDMNPACQTLFTVVFSATGFNSRRMFCPNNT